MEKSKAITRNIVSNDNKTHKKKNKKNKLTTASNTSSSSNKKHNNDNSSKKSAALIPRGIPFGKEKVDTYVAAIHSKDKKEPTLPLREEQLILGVETVLAELSSSSSSSSSTIGGTSVSSNSSFNNKNIKDGGRSGDTMNSNNGSSYHNLQIASILPSLSRILSLSDSSSSSVSSLSSSKNEVKRVQFEGDTTTTMSMTDQNNETITIPSSTLKSDAGDTNNNNSDRLSFKQRYNKALETKDLTSFINEHGDSSSNDHKNYNYDNNNDTIIKNSTNPFRSWDHVKIDEKKLRPPSSASSAAGTTRTIKNSHAIRHHGFHQVDDNKNNDEDKRDDDLGNHNNNNGDDEPRTNSVFSSLLSSAKQQQQQLAQQQKQQPIKRNRGSSMNNTAIILPSTLTSEATPVVLSIRSHICVVSYIQSLIHLWDGPQSGSMIWKQRTSQSVMMSMDDLPSTPYCFLCGKDSTESPIFHGCRCNTNNCGWAHVECYVKRARNKTLEKQNKIMLLQQQQNSRRAQAAGGNDSDSDDEVVYINNNKDHHTVHEISESSDHDTSATTQHQSSILQYWIRCSKCQACYTGDVQTAMAYGYYRYGRIICETPGRRTVHDITVNNKKKGNKSKKASSSSSMVHKPLMNAHEQGMKALQRHKFDVASEYFTVAMALCRLEYSEEMFCKIDSQPNQICFLLAATLSRAQRFQEAMNVLQMIRRFVKEYHHQEYAAINRHHSNTHQSVLLSHSHLTNEQDSGIESLPITSKLNVYAINICATAGYLTEALQMAKEDCDRHVRMTMAMASTINNKHSHNYDDTTITNTATISQADKEKQYEMCIMSTLNYSRLLFKNSQLNDGIDQITKAYELSKQLLGSQHPINKTCYDMMKWAEPSKLFNPIYIMHKKGLDPTSVPL